MNKLDDIDFMSFIGKQESQFITNLSEFSDDIKNRFKHGTNIFGDELPWSKTHDHFRMRPSEVTIWAGINGHGKSLVLSHVMAHLMKTTTCLIASLEMPIVSTGNRLLRQIGGLDNPTERYIQQMLDWTNGRLWIYDELDTVKSERILGMCIYAMTELNIKHIVIDSLMKCGINGDDYNKQKSFVDRLCWAAKTHGGHIHLVHHMRKGRSEHEAPDKFDVKGAGEITDLVDNLVIVHRNKDKEMQIQKGEQINEGEPDTTLTIAKQRHGEWEGKINLWFHKVSNQFLPGPNTKPEWFDTKKVDPA